MLVTLVGVLYGRGSQTMLPGYLHYLTVTRNFNNVYLLITVELPFIRIADYSDRLGLALRVNLS
jgi:hypothetical protein